MSNYGFFSGLYFPVFGRNTRRYGPEKTLYLGTFIAVCIDKVSFLQRNPPLPSSILNMNSFAFLNAAGRVFSLKKLI